MTIVVGDLVRCQSNELMTETYIGKVIAKWDHSVHVLILHYAPNDRHVVHELMQRIIVHRQQLSNISLTKLTC